MEALPGATGSVSRTDNGGLMFLGEKADTAPAEVA